MKYNTAIYNNYASIYRYAYALYYFKLLNLNISKTCREVLAKNFDHISQHEMSITQDKANLLKPAIRAWNIQKHLPKAKCEFN